MTTNDKELVRSRVALYVLTFKRLYRKRNEMQRALFLDRDGVINMDVNYAHRAEQIVFIEGIFEVVRTAKAQGCRVIVVTNQAGIARGYYTEAQFHALMQWMQERFTAEEAAWDAYYYCPHMPDAACECRKPMPGMLTRAQADWDIDMAGSLMIGDRESDMQAARAAGVGRTLLFEAGNLAEAVKREGWF